MSKKAIIVLADGFEETEAISPIDLLNRAEIDVTVAGLNKDVITGAHGFTMKGDILFEAITELPDVLIFPGGMPGTERLASSTTVKDMIIKMNSEGKIIAAICASPALVLAPTGVLNGKKATCYPGMENNFSAEVSFVEEDVVCDGNIITSRGPATALSFGHKIAECLVGKNKADMIAEHMLFSVN